MLTNPAKTFIDPALSRRAKSALRAMLLVKNGVVYCSSLFGARHYQLAAVMPTFVDSNAGAGAPLSGGRKRLPRW
ncbi:CSS-motif domain-containing protein [Serratia marcescens]|uniref:CSS-motif domain-containing protein n=1 Tax=Serratia marcescens TaxID=615 RepID=A0A939SUJ8_SERMA|nr:CSS-motif domain-containing protein [Serratia marcescens]